MDDEIGIINLTRGAQARADILVSICFSDLPPTEAAFAALRDLAHLLDTRFRFREIILVVDENGHENYLPLVEQIKDLRLFTIRPGNSYYDRRVIAAEEAIGDVVLIGNAYEMAHIDLLEMIEQAGRKNTILLATRSIRHSVSGWLSGECPELCVSGPVHAVSDTQASKRSPNIMANWLRAANHSLTFLPSFSKLRIAR